MSSYYLWIELLMNYNFFNKQLGNIMTTLEQYNVHNKWHCFLFETIDLCDSEHEYEQKIYYTKDVLAVLRNTFELTSDIDSQFMALVLAKDVLYKFFKAIPNAFDNIQLQPCYTLDYPDIFTTIYFCIYNEHITENICGYELRELVKTINIYPSGNNPHNIPGHHPYDKICDHITLSDITISHIQAVGPTSILVDWNYQACIVLYTYTITDSSGLRLF